MPRTVLSPPMGQPLLPDVPNWSWHEYGMRAGFWRQFKALTDRNMPVTLGAERQRLQLLSPRRLGRARGRLRIHGPRLRSGPDAQARQPGRRDQAGCRNDRKIHRQAAAIMGKSGPDRDRGDLDLLRLNGIEYVADWVIDDLPQDIATPHGTITTIPYSVETNDIVIHALQHLTSEQFLKRCTDQFDRLYLEGANQCADHGDLHPSLHYRGSASHQISGSAARLCHRP